MREIYVGLDLNVQQTVLPTKSSAFKGNANDKMTRDKATNKYYKVQPI